MKNEYMKLNNGVQIPKLGLGTWLIDDSLVVQAVRDAVKIGYRHIDTAQAYENEHGVGEGIRSCEKPRDEVFVTSKVAAENKTYDSALNSINETMRKMQRGCVEQAGKGQICQNSAGNTRLSESGKHL